MNQASDGEIHELACKALEEEFEFFHGPLESCFPSGESPDVRAAALRSLVHSLPPDDAPTALCLSGGGIRSATFCLGVLQGLARRGLLDRFHYLSTVSGGGYIGSWLSSRIKWNGLKSTVRELATAGTGIAPEAQPIRRLRAYSNYLAPVWGQSTDFFTLVATFLRNLFLNWAVLLPLLLAAVLLPRLYLAVLLTTPSDVPSVGVPGGAMLTMAAILVGIGIAYKTAALPGQTARKQLDNQFAQYCFLPVVAGAVLIGLFGYWYRDAVYSWPWWYLAAGGAILHLAGVAAGVFWRGLSTEVPTTRRITDAVFVAISGFLGGLLLRGGVLLVNEWPEAVLLYGTLVVPALLVFFWLGSTFYVGFVRRSTSEDDREWWARAGAWWLRGAIAWSVGFALVIYAPQWIMRIPWFESLTGAQIGTGSGVLGVLTGLMGYWAKNGSSVRERAEGIVSALGVRILDLAALVFILALTVSLSLFASWVLDPNQQATRWVENLSPFRHAALKGPEPYERTEATARSFSAALKAVMSAASAAESSSKAARAAIGVLGFAKDSPEVAAAMSSANNVATRMQAVSNSAIQASENAAKITDSLPSIIAALGQAEGSLAKGALDYALAIDVAAQDAMSAAKAVEAAARNVEATVSELPSNKPQSSPLRDAPRANEITGAAPTTARTLDVDSAIRILGASTRVATTTSNALLAATTELGHYADILVARAKTPSWHVTYVSNLLSAGALSTFALLALVAAIGLGAAYYVGANTFSLHSMYGSRLVRAYLGATRLNRNPNWFTGFDNADNLPMKDLKSDREPGHRRLMHVVNIALNLVRPAGERLEWQQRKAASFTVSPLASGSPSLGYVTTSEYSGGDGISLGRAMAISGAAASPSMGYHTSPLVAFAMTLINVRLGWWLPNPSPKWRSRWSRTEPGWGLVQLLREGLSNTTDDSAYVYLSDGGHFENLGLYEMVRRRCRRIVVVDASCDPGYKFDDLENAVRKIRVDFGIGISFPAGLPTIANAKVSKRHIAIGVIRYADADVNAPDGQIVYIKPVLTGHEPLDVRRYADDNSKPGHAFPHQPTADQFFNESQFESYRMLGLCSVLTSFPEVGWPTAGQNGTSESDAGVSSPAAFIADRSTAADDSRGPGTRLPVRGDMLSGAGGALRSVGQTAVLASAITVGGALGVAGTVALTPGATVSLKPGSEIGVTAADRRLLDRGLSLSDADRDILKGGVPLVLDLRQVGQIDEQIKHFVSVTTRLAESVDKLADVARRDRGVDQAFRAEIKAMTDALNTLNVSLPRFGTKPGEINLAGLKESLDDIGDSLGKIDASIDPKVDATRATRSVRALLAEATGLLEKIKLEVQVVQPHRNIRGVLTDQGVR